MHPRWCKISAINGTNGLKLRMRGRVLADSSGAFKEKTANACITTGMFCWYLVNGLFHPYISTVGCLRPANRL